MTDITNFACGLVLGGILGRCRWAAMRDALFLQSRRMVRPGGGYCLPPDHDWRRSFSHENTAPNSSEERPRRFRRSEPDELFIRMDEGRIQRGNGTGGSSTPKPDIIPQGQDPGPVRHISVGYQPRAQGGRTNPPSREP